MANRLRPIDEPIGFDPMAPPEPAPPVPNEEPAGTNILLMALRALSQRTIIAISNLFVLAAAGSAFWLWYVTLPQPSVPQLVGLGLYGMLILALTHLVLRR